MTIQNTGRFSFLINTMDKETLVKMLLDEDIMLTYERIYHWELELEIVLRWFYAYEKIINRILEKSDMRSILNETKHKAWLIANE